MKTQNTTKVAELIVKCLEEEGVEYIFGLPGEENIDFVEALSSSKKIRFILTRHEQAASFMADIYGRLTGKPGVCLATLGPGAINLLLGTADANLDSSPLVAIAAQASLDRLNKESHQIIDLNKLFAPVTKWNAMISLPSVAPELVRKAFKLAQSERSGAVALILPEDVAKQSTFSLPLKPQWPKQTMPNLDQIKKSSYCYQRGEKGHYSCWCWCLSSSRRRGINTFCRAYQNSRGDNIYGQGCCSCR
ncbi:acetolactate synthase [Legionella hackeliae]|uniref:thiamine pyrophosphate-binding protein n=1 Tax=Legionella hackeliae TaxID=449 RepID=UPI000E1B0DB3|nr:thiamine pyrophosphate-binding protein [Legionella hackeliae]STX49453.1 acetolactate synthase [Legionella hackeliae]